MASKQDTSTEDWERQMEKMRAELEDKIGKLQSRLTRTLEREGRLEAEEEDIVGRLQDSLTNTRKRMQKNLDNSRDAVREHPLLMVGGAVAIGLMLGAILAKSRD
jgi:ElaB/YqjD/DUF883 family membrane-anchored ribosome-binding protein